MSPAAWRRVLAAAVTALAFGAWAVAPAVAAPTGRLAQIEQTETGLQVVLLGSGLPEGTSIDPGSVRVDLDGHDLQAQASLLTQQAAPVERTAMLVLDTSGSMKGAGLDGAKAAAGAFLDALPAGVSVGLVTFSSTATLAVAPTPDRDTVRAKIGALVADGDTALHDATILAVQSLPTRGIRNIVLLTDGTDDGSTATIEQAAGAVAGSQASLAAVSFGTQPEQTAALATLAAAGQGSVIATDAAGDLAAVFQQAAREIGDQVVVDITVPEELRGTSGNLTVTAEAGGQTLSASAFTDVAQSAPPADAAPGVVVADQGPMLSTATMVLALVGLFVAVSVIVATALGAATRSQRPEELVRRRLSIYTLTGRQPRKQTEEVTRLGDNAVARSAVELAGRVVQQRDLESVLGSRLEAAAIPLKSAEWLIVHVGVAVSASLVLFLASGGNVFATLIGLAIGLALPWVYLSFKQSRREKAFMAALPDTLQLMAGGLQAGYSMPQAIDSVVREGNGPIAVEFNRALIEARLGVPIEDALDGIGARMRSLDFTWVVMAIRIQREVGGNLAEILTTVADTLRERERLRRQVQTLSAEGRLSAWILGALPVVFALYLLVTRPEYLSPLVSDALGIAILVVGVALMAVGAFWLTKVVKVEV